MDTKIQALEKKLAKTVAELQALIADPQGDGGKLNEAQLKRFVELETAMSTIDGQIIQQKLIAEINRLAPGGTGVDPSLFKAKTIKFLFTDAIIEQVSGLLKSRHP